MPGGLLYFKNVVVNGALSIQDGGTAPTSALTGTGWTVAKLAAGNFSLMAANTKRASTAFSTTDALGTPSFSAASCWRSESPYTGVFDNTNWTFVFRIRASAAAAGQTGRVKVRVWKSTAADGTGATQLTSAALTGSSTVALSTTASADSQVTWATPGSQTFNNEYLWVQCEWEVRAVSSNNSGDALFYVESSARITTPTFTVPPVFAQRRFRFRTDADFVDNTPTWAQPEDTSIPAGSYQDINYRLRISLENSGAGTETNTYTLQYSRNSGAYTAITTSSAVVQAVDAGASTDGTIITTQRLTSASGSYVSGRYCETGTTGSLTLGSGSFAEYEYGIRVVAADVANNDTIDFRIFPNTTGVITQTVTPRITVAVSAGVTGTGALAAGASAVSGSGTSASVGTGVLAAGAATVVGAGNSSSVGTGTLVAGAATLAGSGTVAAAAITGTGALVAGSATLAGAGVSVSTGTGVLAAGSATAAGAGVSASAGTGALAAQSAVIAGTGASASLGTGALASGIAAIAGDGISASAGIGALVAGAAEIAGTGSVLAAGDAVASGAILPLTLALLAGVATGEGVQPPIFAGGVVRQRRAATAPGVEFGLLVSLQPGRVSVDAAASGAVLPLRTAIVAGNATGDATGYDNDLTMLMAA